MQPIFYKLQYSTSHDQSNLCKYSLVLKKILTSFSKKKISLVDWEIKVDEMNELGNCRLYLQQRILCRFSTLLL